MGHESADLAVIRDEDGDPEFAGVWHEWSGVEAKQQVGLSAADQLVQARELIAAGWRPVALSAADARLTTSVWHRPEVTDAAFQVAGRRRGFAAAALLALGEAESMWPAFRFPDDRDPTARSYLQVRLAGIGIDPLVLMRRFEAEPEVSAKRALLIALGDFPVGLVPAAERAAFSNRLLALYREHPDPGLHGAIDWLLRQKWGNGKELAELDAELANEARARAVVRAVPGAVPLSGVPLPLGPLLPEPRVAVGRTGT